MESKLITIVLLLLAGFITGNTRLPLVGIISVVEGNSTESIVEANYVRWLEASGADSVVIHPWQGDEEVNEILKKINGILIQGGNVTLDSNDIYLKLVTSVLEKTINLVNTTTNIIPVFAIGQGFQAIHYAIAKNETVVATSKAYNKSTPLNFNRDFIKTSKLFSLFESDDIETLLKKPVTFHDHNLGIEPVSYESTEILKTFFTITATATDEIGKSFIASVEANNHPIFGVQFQPEHISFERNPKLDVNHSVESIRISRALGNFFVQHCKIHNQNVMKPEEYTKYNYIDTYKQFPIKKEDRYVYVYQKPQKNA